MADKKLKKLSKKDEQNPQGTAKVIMDSANQIWLAGLGAFSKAQEEGGKIFDALVKEGSDLEAKTRKTTSAKVHEVRGVVEGTVSQVQQRASKSIDKLEQVFEDRVARALNALGVPTSKDVQELSRRVEELQNAVDTYNQGTGSGAAAPAKKKTVRKTAAKKATAKKTASKKTLAKKSATKKSASKS